MNKQPILLVPFQSKTNVTVIGIVMNDMANIRHAINRRAYVIWAINDNGTKMNEIVPK